MSFSPLKVWAKVGTCYTGCNKVLGGPFLTPKWDRDVAYRPSREYWGSQCWGVEWTLTEAMLHPKLALLVRPAAVQWVGHCPADLKGHGLDSRLGHLPGLLARSRRRHVRGSQSMFLPFPPSFVL